MNVVCISSARFTRCVSRGFLTFFLGFALITTASAQFGLSSESETKGAFQIIIKAFNTYQNLKETGREKQIALQYEENLEFPSLKEIRRIEGLIEEKSAELHETEVRFADIINPKSASQYDETDEIIVEKLLSSIQSDIETLETEKSTYEQTYATRKEKQQTNIRTLKQEIEDLQEDIDKQFVLIKSQLTTFLFYVGLFVGLVGLFLLLRLVVQTIIGRLTFSEPRKKALLQVNRYFFNGLLIVVILAAVFSQFVNFLPFLAILGTGLAFAVRDSIASFIAWFVIGTERGYRAGDTIEFDGFVGRVIEVKPILTALVDMTPGWNSGKVITAPNKIIFEKTISNWSRCAGMQNFSADFLLSEDSDVAAAQNILHDIIRAETERFFPEAEAHLKRRGSECHYNVADLAPSIWVEIDTHGVWIRSRFLGLKSHEGEIISATHEQFLKVVQTHPNIRFQFTEVGRSQSSQS